VGHRSVHGDRTTTDVKTYQIPSRRSRFGIRLLVTCAAGQCVTAPTFEFKTGERPHDKVQIEFAAWSQKESLLIGILT